MYQRLLPFFNDVFDYPRPGGHDKQLYGHVLDVHFQIELYKRSVFGMVDVHNWLPQYAVDAQSVQDFRKELTKIARTRCRAGGANWQFSFSNR